MVSEKRTMGAYMDREGQMPNNSNRIDYLGYAITTRWTELEQATGPWCQQFGASYSVEPPDATEPSWQAFPNAAFTTRIAAAANSRMVAMTSVDQDIAAHTYAEREPERPIELRNVEPARVRRVVHWRRR